MKIQPDSILGHLIIIRGIAGSGKSTLARKMLEDLEAEHFEADMYFMDDEGHYNWDPAFLGSAHSWCKRKTRQALLDGKNVIVSNTFIKRKELKPYLNMECASLAIFEAKGDYGSIHDVPDSVINRMRNSWEELPSEYNENKGN